MLQLILLTVFIVFFIGVLVGVRCQEVNLRRRERQLAQERRRVNEKLNALAAYQDVNNLIWEAQDELREAGLLQTRNVPVAIHFPPETCDRQRKRFAGNSRDARSAGRVRVFSERL